MNILRVRRGRPTPEAPDLPKSALSVDTSPAEINRSALTVVVVTYNNADHIDDCLRSITAQLPSEQSRIVVVDNASGDRTASIVEQHWCGVELIPSSDNLGYAQACNRATNDLRTRYVLFVNPDATLQSGCIDALLDVASRYPQAGLYGGRCYSPDGQVDPRSCFGRPTVWSLFCFTTGLSTIFSRSRWLNAEGIGAWPRDTERHVDIVSGSLLLIDRAIWEQLGGFDNQFFMYGEDFDLSIRASAMGSMPIVTPRAGMIHIGGASSSALNKQILLFRGKVTLVRKLWTGPKRVSAERMILGGVWIRSLLANIRKAGSRSSGRLQLSPEIWSALWHCREDWRNGWPIDQGNGPQ